MYLDADERTNRILMIGQVEQLAIVEEIVEALDVAQHDPRMLRVYDIVHLEAADAKTKLEELEVIGKARAAELEALQEEFFLLKEGRIRLIGEQLKAIQAEIGKRDLSQVNTEKLLELQLRYFGELKGEYVETGPRTKTGPKLNSSEIAGQLGAVLARYRAGEIGESQAKLDQAGAEMESVADFVAAIPDTYADLCKQAIEQIHRLHTSGKLPAVYHEEDAKEVEPLLNKWEKDGLVAQRGEEALGPALRDGSVTLRVRRTARMEGVHRPISAVLVRRG